MADSGSPFRGVVLCLGFLEAHLVGNLIFFPLMLHVLLYLLFIPPRYVQVISPFPKVTIAILVLQLTCLSNIMRLLFPLRYPMICDTLYSGGILISL